MKKLIISIPSPCHESWDKMTPAGQGRFCGSCQKQVIDFSNMTDEQVALHFKRTNGATCGRFSRHQLNRSLELPKKRIPWIKYFFQVALPALLVSKAAAQTGEIKRAMGDTVTYHNTGSRRLPAARPAMMEKLVTGKIVDENGAGVPYASVFMKGTTITTATDSAGRFAIRYREDVDPVVLQCSSIGYATVEHAVPPGTGEQIITMQMNSTTLDEVVLSSRAGYVLGGMTGGVMITKVTFFDAFIERIIPGKMGMTVFPNPVRSNGVLNVQTRTGMEGYHTFQLVAVNGQEMMVKELLLNKHDNLVQLQLPRLVAGSYFITAIDKRSGKSITAPIVVLNE